ncbi:unnamed protein product [Caenorhabditis auriculariae]|uniref:Uncharacterized protein n=1 Tax=Caenorhabditis auriculariae TaxID=2777116 RepID=A0A8S1HVX8_9PELO|nr:unnamed protein product [Caenorhabditis auriculariae]
MGRFLCSNAVHAKKEQKRSRNLKKTFEEGKVKEAEQQVQDEAGGTQVENSQETPVFSNSRADANDNFAQRNVGSADNHTPRSSSYPFPPWVPDFRVPPPPMNVFFTPDRNFGQLPQASSFPFPPRNSWNAQNDFVQIVYQPGNPFSIQPNTPEISLNNPVQMGMSPNYPFPPRDFRNPPQGAALMTNLGFERSGAGHDWQLGFERRGAGHDCPRKSDETRAGKGEPDETPNSWNFQCQPATSDTDDWLIKFDSPPPPTTSEIAARNSTQMPEASKRKTRTFKYPEYQEEQRREQELEREASSGSSTENEVEEDSENEAAPPSRAPENIERSGVMKELVWRINAMEQGNRRALERLSKPCRQLEELLEAGRNDKKLAKETLNFELNTLRKRFENKEKDIKKMTFFFASPREFQNSLRILRNERKAAEEKITNLYNKKLSDWTSLDKIRRNHEFRTELLLRRLRVERTQIRRFSRKIVGMKNESEALGPATEMFEFWQKERNGIEEDDERKEPNRLLEKKSSLKTLQIYNEEVEAAFEELKRKSKSRWNVLDYFNQHEKYLSDFLVKFVGVKGPVHESSVGIEQQDSETSGDVEDPHN